MTQGTLVCQVTMPDGKGINAGLGEQVWIVSR